MASYEEKTREPAVSNLEDDSVKLIAYTIVSLKPDDERIMEGGQKSVVITDNIKTDAFVSWILAKYLQEEVPYPEDSKRKVPRSQLIDPDEMKYLRVYYVVSNRWPREARRFKEREIDELHKIRNAIV